jgi:hypothetical protein
MHGCIEHRMVKDCSITVMVSPALLVVAHEGKVLLNHAF